MKSVLCLSLLILLMPSAYAAELPGDSADGSVMHDANCLGCHDTSVYTRKDRRIRSLDALKGQLASCSHMASPAPVKRCEHCKFERLDAAGSPTVKRFSN